MKNIIIATALCAGSIVPAIAQAPAAAPEAAAISTNELVIKAFTGFTAVFNHAASADSEENAKKAATAIDDEVVKLKSTRELLEKAKAPSDSDMAELATQVVKYEAEMSAAMQKMMQSAMTNQDASKGILDEPMAKFSAEANALGKIMETLYPQDKMQPLVDAEKQKQKAAEAK